MLVLDVLVGMVLDSVYVQYALTDVQICRGLSAESHIKAPGVSSSAAVLPTTCISQHRCRRMDGRFKPADKRRVSSLFLIISFNIATTHTTLITFC